MMQSAMYEKRLFCTQSKCTRLLVPVHKNVGHVSVHNSQMGYNCDWTCLSVSEWVCMTSTPLNIQLLYDTQFTSK